MRNNRSPVACFMAVCLAVALSACVQKPLPPLPAGESAVAQYHLGAGDKLKVDTFGEPTLSGEFEIAASGQIDFPLIGATPAAGRTTDEVADAIRARLANGLMKNPQVNVQIVNYRPFFILGEVEKSGSYPYTSGLTVLNAVATAQGFTYRANTKRVFIRHMGENEEHEVSLTAATPVLPGDTVRIGERYF